MTGNSGYARIFVRGHYLFREANSFPRAKLKENCELQIFFATRAVLKIGGYLVNKPLQAAGMSADNVPAAERLSEK